MVATYQDKYSIIVCKTTIMFHKGVEAHKNYSFQKADGLEITQVIGGFVSHFFNNYIFRKNMFQMRDDKMRCL